MVFFVIFFSKLLLSLCYLITEIDIHNKIIFVIGEKKPNSYSFFNITVYVLLVLPNQRSDPTASGYVCD